MRDVVLGVLITSACSAPAEPHPPLAPVDARPQARPDAFEITSCWLEDVTPVPRGSVTIGAGYDAFEPIASQLALEYGPSGGFVLPLNVRMTGLVPGSLTNVFDPHNPRTRFRVSFAESGQPLVGNSPCFAPGTWQAAAAFTSSPPVLRCPSACAGIRAT